MLDWLTGTKETPATAVIRVQRFNPDVDGKPYFQEFTVPVTEDNTLLDALQLIKNEMDGSLTFRRSCRHAICGSCAHECQRPQHPRLPPAD
jgi:succinate dehydrogenase/fumarate reductase-like Fe-S protein